MASIHAEFDMFQLVVMGGNDAGYVALIHAEFGVFQLVETTQAVFRVMQKTLLAVQATTLGVDVITEIRLAVQELVDQGLVVQSKVGNDSPQQRELEDVLAAADKSDDAIRKRSSCASKEGVDRTRDISQTLQGDNVSESLGLSGEAGSQRSKRMRLEGETKTSRRSVGTPTPLVGDAGTDRLCSLPRSNSQGSCHASHSSCGELKLDVTELGKATFKGNSL